MAKISVCSTKDAAFPFLFGAFHEQLQEQLQSSDTDRLTKLSKLRAVTVE